MAITRRQFLRNAAAVGAMISLDPYSGIKQLSSQTVKPLSGLDYSPFRPGQSPDTGSFPSAAQIDDDLGILEHATGRIRTYGLDNTLGNIPGLCAVHGIECYLGAWIYNSPSGNRAFLERMVQLAPSAKALVVGNEVLTRGDQSLDTLIGYISEMRTRTGKNVTTAENWDVYLANPKLGDAVDFVFAHVHPFHAYIPVKDAAQFVLDKWNALETAFGSPVIIGETGWPTEGPAKGEAVPSIENQLTFVSDLRKLANAAGMEYFLFEAFDEPWKPAGSEQHWGVYNSIGEPKHSISSLVPYTKRTNPTSGGSGGGGGGGCFVRTIS
jgi:exo-beta-1,3-glucanase (GH17 family)